MNRLLKTNFLCLLVAFAAIGLTAGGVKEVSDTFDVDGSARKSGSKLVGTKTINGSAVWVSSPTHQDRSFELTDIFDLVKNGQIRIPVGQQALANGVAIPAMTAEEQLSVEFDITLHKSSFAAVVVSSDWGNFWKGLIFSAMLEKNGKVGIVCPGVRKKSGKENSPWWLRKDQPINIKLIYNAKAGNISVVLKGIPQNLDNPKWKNTVVIENKLKVPDDLYKKIKFAGIFLNGDEARVDNFKVLIEPAHDDPLGIQAQTKKALDNGKVTITVEKGARQTFEGFGANLMGGPDFNKISDEEHAKLAKALWSDAKFNSLRLWHWTWHGRKKFRPGIESLQERYVNNKVIAHAQKAGMNTILLTGDHYPPDMTVKNEKERTVIKPESLKEYAGILADLVLKTKQQNNIEIGYVGLQNEPGAHDPFRPEDFPPAVKYLREALDERGLKNVKIVAPESADVSSNFFKTLELLKADPEAWKALDVIATHSYAMVANQKLEKIIEESGKPLWITEASNAPPDDCRAASTMTGLCLNDLNHLTNRWMWFIGYGGYPKNWNTGGTGPLLIQFWYKPEPFRMEEILKYYYFMSLSQSFDVGCGFRKSISSLEDRMHWRGKTERSPKITVATAKNPDGSWGVAALNYTTGPNTPPDVNPGWKWPRRPGYPEKEYEVTVFIEELASAGEQVFKVKECSGELKNADGGTVKMKNGKFTFKIKPMHLKTFRSIN